MTSHEKLDDEPGAGAPPRPLRADAERNRQRLLAAAVEVFAQRGLDATLDDIAAHAGLGVGTAYRRFANKQEVIEALFEIRLTGMIELAETCALDPDAGRGLTHFLQETCARMTADRGFRDALIRGGTGSVNAGNIRERLLPILVGLVQKAQAAGAVRADFHPLDVPMIIVMMESVADTTDRLDPRLWERYLSLVLDGISERSAARPLPGAPLDSDQMEQAMHNRSHRNRH